ncbi:MAG TPA: FAD-dependent monooxygenase [Acidimicrobiia bacterium]
MGAPAADVDQVLVVGAGPTGLLLAAELERRGVGCLLIDAHDAPAGWDRATVIHARSLEVFESLGVVDRFLAAGVRVRGVRFHSNGEVLGELEHRGSGSRYGFELGVSEEVTEAVLTEHLEAQGGSVTRSTRLVGVAPEATGVTATVESGGRRRDVPVAWVVGCDGFHSTTRELAGIGYDGHDIAAPWAVFDCTLEGWDQPYDVNPAYLDRPSLTLTALPGRRWRAYLRPTSESSDLVAEATGVLRHYEPGVSVTDVEHPARFHCHTKVARRYRAGRILLAGDAAHVCSPNQGHGMNTGIQDAYNLAWKLALVCDGHAGTALLDSYEAERRPVAIAVGRSGDEVEESAGLRDPGARAARDRAIRAVYADPRSAQHEAVAGAELDVSYAGSPIVSGDGNGHLGPGERLPETEPVRLRNGDVCRLHELARRPGHTVLVLGRAGHGERVAATAGDVHAAVDRSPVADAVVALSGDDDAPDPVGNLGPAVTDQLGIETITILLIRPDRFVGFRSDHADVPALSGALSALLR